MTSENSNETNVEPSQNACGEIDIAELEAIAGGVTPRALIPCI